MKRYTCDLCPKTASDKKALRRHKETYHNIVCPEERDPTTGHAEGHAGHVTQEISKSNAEMDPKSTPGHVGHASSTSDSPSEIQGPGSRDPRDPDPLVEIRDASAYLDSRRDYLNRWELGFVASVSFILNNKTNGDRARSITPDMVAKLFETKAKVEGLEERDKQEAEYDRIQRHFSDMKQPGHPSATCPLCIKDKEDRERLIRESDAQDAEMEPSRAADRARNLERLRGARSDEDARAAVVRRTEARKRIAARKAATPGAENREGADVR